MCVSGKPPRAPPEETARIPVRVTHPINTPYQYTLSTHPINTPCQYTLLNIHPGALPEETARIPVTQIHNTHPVNTYAQTPYTINTSCQYTNNAFCQHNLCLHHLKYPVNTSTHSTLSNPPIDINTLFYAIYQPHTPTGGWECIHKGPLTLSNPTIAINSLFYLSINHTHTQGDGSAFTRVPCTICQ